MAGGVVTAVCTRVRVKKRKPDNKIAKDEVSQLCLEIRIGVYWKIKVELMGLSLKQKEQLVHNQRGLRRANKLEGTSGRSMGREETTEVLGGGRPRVGPAEQS